MSLDSLLFICCYKFAVAATQVAFGYGGALTTIKSYGVPKGGVSNRSQGSASTGMLYIDVVYMISW